MDWIRDSFLHFLNNSPILKQIKMIPGLEFMIASKKACMYECNLVIQSDL